MLQLSFCWGKKYISQLGYHPSSPAHGALSPSVSGSTWHFQAGLITHLPSQTNMWSSCKAMAAFVLGKEQSRAFVGEHMQGSTESGCWSCSRHHKPKISVCVAFRPRLALTRLVSQKIIRVSLVSSRVEWMQKHLCKFVVLLIFWGWFNQHCVLHMFCQKGLPRAVTYTLREKLLFVL